MGLFSSSSSSTKAASHGSTARKPAPPKSSSTTVSKQPSTAAAGPLTWNFPMTKFEPICYVPRRDKDLILGFPVFEVLVVGHEMLKEGGNHWCFYLQVGDRRSVRLDPTPGPIPASKIPGGSKANIVVSFLKYPVSNAAQHSCNLSVQKGLTVRDFIDAIVNNGRDKYEFNAAGRGCRTWTTQQIDLCLRLKLLTKAQECRNAQQDMMWEYHKLKRTGRKHEMDNGAYYA